MRRSLKLDAGEEGPGTLAARAPGGNKTAPGAADLFEMALFSVDVEARAGV